MSWLSREAEDLAVGLAEDVVIDDAAYFGYEVEEGWLVRIVSGFRLRPGRV